MATGNDTGPAGPRRAAAGLAAFALAGGLLTLLGWAADIVRLTDWDVTGISMQPNAALAAVLAAGSLLLSSSHRTVSLALGVACGLIGGAVLVQHLTGVDLGIDRLLLHKPWGHEATVTPGRIGPPASLSFALLGLGLCLAHGEGGGLARRAARHLGLIIAAVALLPAIGYLFGASILYTVPRLTGIALQTALILLALAVALVASVAERDPARTLAEDSAAGELARLALPLVVVLPLVLGWLVVQGRLAGLYDTGMGMALLVMSLILMPCAILWWGVVSVGTRERALAAANEVRGRADVVLGTARDKYFFLDAGWHCLYANARAAGFTGRTREDMIGRTLWELWPEAAGSAIEEAGRRVLASRGSEVFEYHSDALGRWFDVRLHATADGGLALLALDVTTRKQAEEILREAGRRKDEFLATLAHELRNPLAPIKNMLEVIARAGGDAAVLGQGRAMMERQVTQLVRLIDDLLDVSRITRDRLTLRKEPCELATVLRHSAEACRPQAEAAGLALEVSLPPEPIPLDADAVRLTQVFGNLLTNACKYTPSGGRVRVEVGREGGEAVVTVSDTGVGIPAAMLEEVFEMFTQVDASLERSRGGLGIGLALARRLADMHGGTLTASSAGPGQGSTFVVRLPAGEAPVPAAPPPAEAAPVAPRRILIVDDNHDAAESLALLLSQAGNETRMAHDGMQAVDMAAEFRPEVILLDIGMPVMDGYDACRSIRAREWGRGVLILALTGWGQEEDRRRSKEAGFDAHLVKPVDCVALMGLLAGARAAGPAAP